MTTSRFEFGPLRPGPTPKHLAWAIVSVSDYSRSRDFSALDNAFLASRHGVETVIVTRFI